MMNRRKPLEHGAAIGMRGLAATRPGALEPAALALMAGVDAAWQAGPARKAVRRVPIVNIEV